MSEDSTPTIFLSYAREDIADARRVYDYLSSVGAEVWFDQEALLPGANWKNEITRAIRHSRYFVAILSNQSVSKKGFVQAEIGKALDVLAEYPDDEIYLIPVRLNDCEPSHPKLNDLSWLDLYPNWYYGVHRLAQAFNVSTVICSGLYATLASKKTDKHVLRTYLRFYDDGTVVSCCSTGEPHELSAWFNRHHSLSTKSSYSVKNGILEFVGAGDYQYLDYKGKIVGRELELHWHNKDKGDRGVDTFKWQEWTES